MSLLNNHKTNARHLPLVQHLALAPFLHLFHEILSAMHPNFGMLTQLALNEQLIDVGIAVNELVAVVTEAHQIVGIVGAIHAGRHHVVKLHLGIFERLAAAFTFATPTLIDFHAPLVADACRTIVQRPEIGLQIEIANVYPHAQDAQFEHVFFLSFLIHNLQIFNVESFLSPKMMW